jgi:hypothetical protein
MDPLVRRAYGIWNSQKQRCENKRSKSYKNYGAIGIRVEYSAREFIWWWLNEFKNKRPKHPSVGRIDHSKNYSFNNIEMVEHHDNAREMYYRTGGNGQADRIPIVLVNDHEMVVFSSSKLAAKFANVSEPMIKIRRKNSVVLATAKTKFKYNVYTLDDFMRL